MDTYIINFDKQDITLKVKGQGHSAHVHLSRHFTIYWLQVVDFDMYTYLVSHEEQNVTSFKFRAKGHSANRI